jgi:hypothetical protein
VLRTNIMLKRIAAVIPALAIGVGLGWTLAAQDAKPAKNWKDRAEYDLYAAINKAEAKERLPLLDKWKSTYPQSEYAPERDEIYLITYLQMNNCRAGFDTSAEILKTRPNHQRSIDVILGCVYTFNPPQPADLDTAQRVAQYAMDHLDDIYAENNLTAGMTKEQFAAAKPATKATAIRTLGWVPFTKKDMPKAEAELTKGLNMDPTQSTMSNWLANALLAQNKTNPEKQPLALYEFARAAAYDGPNSLPAASRKQIQDYLTRVYKQYHGSEDGLPQLLAVAKNSALPPSDWAGIKSTADIAKEAAEREAQNDAANPMRTLWVKGLKNNLTGDNGASFFESNVKDALLPGGANGVMKFSGKIVSMTPANRPKEIVLGVENGTVGDAKLMFEEPLPGKMEVGEELSFEGVAKEFAKDPYMLTFEVEKEQLQGWTGKGPAGPAKAKGAAQSKAKAASK